MAISHMCMTCGDDLTRVRAPLDPHYALPVVVCPSCATAVVRRVHPIWKRWRFLRRLTATLLALVLQLAAVAIFTTIASAICFQLGNQILGSLLSFDRAGEAFVLLITLGFFPLALGLWLAAGLDHWNRIAAWMVFAGFVALILAMDSVVAPAIELILRRFEAFEPELPFRVSLLLSRLQVLFLIMIVACAGIPARRVVYSFARHLRRASWRIRRRRAKLRSAIE